MSLLDYWRIGTIQFHLLLFSMTFTLTRFFLHWFLFSLLPIPTMLTIDTRTTMDELDLSVTEDILLMRSSRTATFTLSSSSSTSSSYSNLYNHHHHLHQNGLATTSTTMCSPSSSPSNSFVSERHRSFTHTQSLIIENRKRRPTINDPYQLAPNLQVLDDWIIVSSSLPSPSRFFRS